MVCVFNKCMYIKWVHTGKVGVINLYVHTHTNAPARVCVHLVFFESICVAFNCTNSGTSEKAEWNIQNCLTCFLCIIYWIRNVYVHVICSPPFLSPTRLLCSCDVWQTQCLQCLSNCWRWSSRAMLAKLLPESISANRLRGGWKLNLANVYFV